MAISTPGLANARTRQTAYSESQAKEYDQLRFTTENGQCIDAFELYQLSRALKYVSAQPAHILEVGCGTGRLLKRLHDQGHLVDGADASGAMLEEVGRKLGASSSTKLLLAEAANIPAADNTYDLVYAIRLLNQTESPEYALSVVTEMIRLAKPGGMVLVEFVNEHRPRWGRNRRPTTRLKPSEVQMHAEQSGAEFVRSAGCFLVSMQAYHFTPRFLLPVLTMVDRTLSKMLPRLCSRCYFLFHKNNVA